MALYSGYTASQIHVLERLQGEIIDRNRADSLLLLRIQNNLNSLGLAMRDMLDGSEPYPLTAWQAQFRRIRADLTTPWEEAQYSPGSRWRSATVSDRVAENSGTPWTASLRSRDWPASSKRSPSCGCPCKPGKRR